MISVAMCTYNGEKYIAEQLESILNQTRSVDEVIICDDCSQDATVKISNEFFRGKSISFRIIENEENLGIRENFKKCIEACKGDLIFLADQDDVWLPTKVEEMMVEFEKNDNCLLVACDGHIVDKELQVKYNSSWESFNAFKVGFKGSKTTREEFMKIIMYHWFLAGTMMAVRRELIEKSFPYPEDSGWIHDNWLVATAPIYGEVAFVDKPLVLYRQHENNVIGSFTKQRTDVGKTFYHVQHVLFHFHLHYERLMLLMDYKKDDMPQEYLEIISHYLQIYDKNKDYIHKSGVGKLITLVGFMVSNSLKDFNIKRKDVLYYLYNQIAKKDIYEG